MTIATSVTTRTVTLVWQAYDHTHQLVTRAAPVLPDGAEHEAARFGEIPGVRNPRIDTTRTVELGDVPAPRFGWDEDERNEVPMFPLAYAPQAVACPKCRQPGGMFCTSTGGGNTATVATHKARTDRIAAWSNAVQEHAAMLVKTVSYHGLGLRDLFAVFEEAAAPIPAKTAKQPTPKGVRLSEKQAEEIERYVHCGGSGWLPSGHLSGDHQERQTGQALEAKGIIEFVERDEHYDRIMRLTPFGWQVYRQHRLIIRRLSDAEVDALEAAANR